MKKICLILMVLVNVVSATMPADYPLQVTGSNFYLMRGSDANAEPTVYFLFDNTTLYIDRGHDGVYDYDYRKNAGESFFTGDLPITGYLEEGTLIYANKPIVVSQHLGNDNEWIPPTDAFKKEYWIFDTRWYVTAPIDTVVSIDYNDDGIEDNTTVVYAYSKKTITLPDGILFARIYSYNPFYAYTAYGSAPLSAGDDYYLHFSDIVKLYILEDNTTVKVDLNNDGFFDNITVYDKGVYDPPAYNSGAHLKSDKKVGISYSEDWALPSSNYLGSDVWALDGIWYTGLFDNTTYYLDYFNSNDLIPDKTGGVGKNKMDLVGKGHFWSDKPMVFEYGYHIHPSWRHSYDPYPLSRVSALHYSPDKYLGIREIVTMEVRVFNPFALDTINNVSVLIRFPDSFELLGDDLDLLIEKRYLRNDSVNNSEIMTVTTSSMGNNQEFIVEFESLEPMMYYSVRYQLRTPVLVGSYGFDPVVLSYVGESWVVG